MSVTAPAGSEYKYGAASPRGAPASWFAIAQSAENIGHARLVPPHTCHVNDGIWNGTEIAMTPPVNGSASHPTSGTCRHFPGSFFWYDGLAKPPVQLPFASAWTQLLGPPPAPPIKPKVSGGSNTRPSSANSVSLFPHPLCQAIELSALSANDTPPTAVAYGESAGADTV